MRRFLLLPLLLAGCQPAPIPTLTPVCFIAGRPKIPVDTIRIVLPEPVDPARYATATSAVEQFLFAQAYESLVRRDCAGEVLESLADKWDMARDSTWHFQIRPDAQFSDGTRVTASGVAAILTAAATTSGWRITSSGNTVSIRAPKELLPGVLSDRRYVITKPGPAGSWPLGTVGTLSPVTNGVMLSRGGKVMVFTWPPGADARDLLESGIDAVLTNQPAAIEFANVRAAIDAYPLPWSTTYLLVVPPGQSTAFAQGGRPWPEAVPGDVRVSRGPYWWTGAQCAAEQASPKQVTPARVVYPQGDSVARALAERLVARGVPRAEGLAPAELHAAVVQGADHAVIPLARTTHDACAALETAGLAGRPANALLPLVDTRYQLIVRTGRFGVILDGTGNPRIQQ